MNDQSAKYLNNEESLNIDTKASPKSLSSLNTNQKSSLIESTMLFSTTEEEILCDLEVASYFDNTKIDPITYDDYYYAENHSNDIYTTIDSESNIKKSNTKINKNHEDLESSNLEYLVRQLAAEASLTTLNGKYSYSNQPNSNSKKPKSLYSIQANQLLKNISLNDYDNRKDSDYNNNEIKKCSKNSNYIYDLHYENKENEIDEDELGYLNINGKINKDIDSDLESRFNIDEITKSFEHLGNFDDDVESIFISDTSDSLLELNMTHLNDDKNKFKVIKKSYDNLNNNGFMSLKHPQAKKHEIISSPSSSSSSSRPADKTNNFHHHKRSSSSSTYNNNYNTYNHNPSKPATQISTLHLDINKNRITKTNSTNLEAFLRDENNNNNIKIEKKICLNYRKPQNFNALLNFGTLC